MTAGSAPCIRTGVILPAFRETGEDALALARAAEAAGVDGVFCYDHVWPMGQPERPALAPFPLLALVAASTGRVVLGTLVARVGLVPDGVLLAEVDALANVAPGRVVVGLGTGDRLSAAENEAYGVPYASAGDRQASLRACVRGALQRGIPAWVGDGAEATRAVAEEEGAAVNQWDTGPEAIARQARRSAVTWTGRAPRDPGALSSLVARLARAGASWAVFTEPVGVEELAAAGAAAGR